jgi:hypothetical protein
VSDKKTESKLFLPADFHCFKCNDIQSAAQRLSESAVKQSISYQVFCEKEIIIALIVQACNEEGTTKMLTRVEKLFCNRLARLLPSSGKDISEGDRFFQQNPSLVA